jgi:hypothetical protein
MMLARIVPEHPDRDLHIAVEIDEVGVEEELTRLDRDPEPRGPAGRIGAVIGVRECQ